MPVSCHTFPNLLHLKKHVLQQTIPVRFDRLNQISNIQLFFLFVLINQTLVEMLYSGEKSQMLAQKSCSAFVGFIWKA